MGRRRDIFAPRPGDRFTKGEVNRAGSLLRDWWLSDRAATVDEFGVAGLADAMTTLEWFRRSHAQPTKRIASRLRYHVQSAGATLNGRAEVTQRIKRRPTIIDKLTRFPEMKLARMADVGGVRAVVGGHPELLALNRRIKKSWTIVSSRDYVASPKGSGYRAIHHIVRDSSSALVEVQLRTLRQDAWANEVEEVGRSIGSGLKFEQGADDVLEYYRIAGEILAELDFGRSPSGEMRSRFVAAGQRVSGLIPGT